MVQIFSKLRYFQVGFLIEQIEFSVMPEYNGSVKLLLHFSGSSALADMKWDLLKRQLLEAQHLLPNLCFDIHTLRDRHGEVFYKSWAKAGSLPSYKIIPKEQMYKVLENPHQTFAVKLVPVKPYKSYGYKQRRNGHA